MVGANSNGIGRQSQLRKIRPTTPSRCPKFEVLNINGKDAFSLFVTRARGCRAKGPGIRDSSRARQGRRAEMKRQTSQIELNFFCVFQTQDTSRVLRNSSFRIQERTGSTPCKRAGFFPLVLSLWERLQ